jgi:hypothetical protein
MHIIERELWTLSRLCGRRTQERAFEEQLRLLTELTSPAGSARALWTEREADRSATSALWPVDPLCEFSGAEINQVAALDGPVLAVSER